MSKRAASPDDITPAQDFALSILKNRKLTHYVRHVSLNYNHWAGFPAQALSYTVTSEAELEKEKMFKAVIAEQNWEEAEATELLRRLMTTSSQGFNKPSSHQLFPDAVVAETEDEDEGNSGADVLDSADSKASAKKWEEATKSGPYFPNLTHLRIGIKLASRFVELSGKKNLAEWVPAGLEELEIVGYRPQESGVITKQVTEVVQRREELLPNLKVLKGVEEYIESGKVLDNEEDYVASDELVEENAAEEIG